MPFPHGKRSKKQVGVDRQKDEPGCGHLGIEELVRSPAETSNNQLDSSETDLVRDMGFGVLSLSVVVNGLGRKKGQQNWGTSAVKGEPTETGKEKPERRESGREAFCKAG